jgi:hypothetical protein
MNTQNVEIRLLSHDELDAVAGGEPISIAVGLAVSLARTTISVIDAGFNYLAVGAAISSFGPVTVPAPPTPRLPAL